MGRFYELIYNPVLDVSAVMVVDGERRMSLSRHPLHDDCLYEFTWGCGCAGAKVLARAILWDCLQAQPGHWPHVRGDARRLLQNLIRRIPEHAPCTVVTRTMIEEALAGKVYAGPVNN